MATPLDLDRLIEEGLTLYGRGDLDGALLVWEQVLAVEPANEQATSYVDYVRMNYDMLTTDAGEDRPAAPFAIGDAEEPEYMIEVSDGDLPSPVIAGKAGVPQAGAPMYMDPTDASWYIDDELSRRGPSTTAPVRDTSQAMTPSPDADHDDREPQVLALELEADEPPEPEHVKQRAITVRGECFDDATREYKPQPLTEPGAAEPVTFETVTNEFTTEGTPGFTAQQITDVRRRDLGFVRPAPQSSPPPTTLHSLVPPPPIVEAPRRRAAHETPELKMTLRTPTPTRTPPASIVPLERSSKPSHPPAQAHDRSTGVELALPSDELGPLEPLEPDDLIASLPHPKATHVTRDLPPMSIKPAERPPLPPAPTIPPGRGALQSAFDSIELDLPSDPQLGAAASASPHDLGSAAIEAAAQPAHSLTRDFSEKPTTQSQRPPQLDPLVSAPTRELGLRPAKSRAATEDEPTVTNMRALRDKVVPTVRMPFDGDTDDQAGTRADIVLPFDPIDARAAQILDEIDDTAPHEETREDQTRRRITSLLERAQLWTSVDLERAVAAVDLALAEDPASALGQKLIHRNRDVIMGVFQRFLGNLDRQPALARPLHELSGAPISPRAAFLLSRVDGSLSLDEILDVSGMPRLEAYRYLCQLFLRGILR